MTLKMLRIPPDLSLHGPAAGMRELVQRLGVARKGLPLHRIPASQLWINQLLQVSSRFPFLCTQPPWSKET